MKTSQLNFPKATSPLLLAIMLCFFTLQWVVARTKVSQISQYGITWIFDKPVLAGQFINGDWWVVGTVTVVSVTPMPGSVQKDTTHIAANHWNDSSLSPDTLMRNGSMIVDKPSKIQGMILEIVCMIKMQALLFHCFRTQSITHFNRK